MSEESYLNYDPQFDPDDPGDPNFHLRRAKLQFFTDCWDRAHELVEAKMPRTDKNFTLALEFQNAQLTGAGMFTRGWISGGAAGNNIASLDDLVNAANRAIERDDEQSTENTRLKDKLEFLEKQNRELNQRLGN